MSRFEVGGVYKTKGTKHVCVSVSDKCVGIVEYSEHKRNMRDPDFMGYDVEPYEECEKRVFCGIEMATQCCDTDDIEDYEISSEHKVGDEFLEPIWEFKERYRRADPKKVSAKRRTARKSGILSWIATAVILAIVAKLLLG